MSGDGEVGDPSATATPRRVMFLYWGRRGSLPRFTLEVARAAVANPRVDATVSVSTACETFGEFAWLGPRLMAVDTFGHGTGALLAAHRIPMLRRRLVDRLRADRTEAVIELMAHVWSPFVMGAVRAAGVRYAPVIHDATAHPGDRTAWVKSVLDRAMHHADRVLTLSDAVTDRLVASGRVERARVATLFHPDLSYGDVGQLTPPLRDRPLRLLFLGRIMPYKGLPLMLDAADALIARGRAVHVEVWGEGALGPSAARLAALGARVENRWLTEADIAKALARTDVVVLSYVEASQSGVAAAALGAGVPVAATPVGGLIEQVRDGETGVVAHAVDGAALADAILRLTDDPGFYASVLGSIERTRAARSMDRFVDAAVSAVLG